MKNDKEVKKANLKKIDSNSNTKYFGLVILIVVIILLGVLFFLPRNNRSNNSANSNNLIRNSNSEGEKPDCGTVTASYLQSAMNNRTAPPNDALSCMSENLKSCFVSNLVFEGNSGNSNIFYITNSSVDSCELEYSFNNAAGDTTKSINCNFKKDEINAVYSSYQSIGKAYTTSLALSILLALDTVTNKGVTTMNFTDPNTKARYSVPCVIS